MTAVRKASRFARGFVCAAGLTFVLAQTASAQSPAKTTTSSGGVHFGQPGSPIDISAKSTQVFQLENRVVYQGDVEALQGTDRLRTPQLTIWFNKNNAVKAPAPPPGQPSVGPVDRMEAEGPVYFVTATQNAKGDHGSYSAADDTITLTGNVVLTQDKNVSTGDKLIIHQKTGLATLSSEKATGRVRGVFYNEDKNKPANSAPAPATAH